MHLPAFATHSPKRSFHWMKHPDGRKTGSFFLVYLACVWTRPDFLVGRGEKQRRGWGMDEHNTWPRAQNQEEEEEEEEDEEEEEEGGYGKKWISGVMIVPMGKGREGEGPPPRHPHTHLPLPSPPAFMAR